MKNFVRIGSLVLAFGLLAGCASHRSSQTARRSNDFEVVETSTKRLLTPQEMLQLKIAVAKYLDKEGAVASGDYYVKIFLGPDQDGVPADWVVVRFTRDSGSRFALVAAYPANSPGYQSYAAYDYYPYGYDHFSRISFQYYDDPFYGSRYYFPPRRNNRDRDHHHDGDKDHDHGKDHDHNRDNDQVSHQPRPPDRHRFKPIDPVGTPQATPSRWTGDSTGRTEHRRRDNAPRDTQASTQSTSRPDRQPPATRHSGGGPATRSELHRQETPRSQPVRQESNRSESYSRSSESRSYSAPSYSAPARSESNSSSSSSSSLSQSQQDAGRAVVERKQRE